MNRLSTVTDAATPAGVTSYGYDENGNLTSRTDANTHHWTTTYDALNRPMSSSDPLSHQSTVVYDAAGNVIQQFTPNSEMIATAYDGLHRPVKVQGSFGTVEYAYDAASKRTRMTDSTGTTQYLYDAAGRVTSVTAPVSGMVRYGYDAAGRRTSLTYPSGRVVTYTYATGATGGNLTGISTTSPSVSAAYTYDAYGRMQQATTDAGYFTTYGYDGASRLTAVEHKESGGTVFQQALYTLDAAGNRTEVLEISSGASYAYDALHRLVSETRGATTTSYTYDTVGNRLTLAVGAATTTYAYDAANRLTTVTTKDGSATLAYDANGNQLGSGGSTYHWDAFNRLTAITGGSSSSYHTYNGDGLRVQSTAGSTTTTFAWDLSQGTPQLLSDGNDYVYGATGLLAVIPAGGSCAVYAFNDGLGSVQAKRTAGGPAVVEQYDAFGTPLSSGSDPCAEVRLGFAGEQQDVDSGLVYLRARYMDPSTGRFISKDPLPGGNGYTYARNNPSKFVDPGGTDECFPVYLPFPYYHLGDVCIEDEEEEEDQKKPQYSTYGTCPPGWCPPGWPPDPNAKTKNGDPKYGPTESPAIVTEPAWNVYGYVVSHGNLPPPGHASHPYTNDPKHPADSQVLPPGDYYTYDVYPGQAGRLSPERVVVDVRTGRGYYTNNHYNSFAPMVPLACHASPMMDICSDSITGGWENQTARMDP